MVKATSLPTKATVKTTKSNSMTLKGIDEKTVVQCPTEELANKVLGIADKGGLKWSDGSSFSHPNNHWKEYRENTCYFLTKGTYCSVDYFLKNIFFIYSSARGKGFPPPFILSKSIIYLSPICAI